MRSILRYTPLKNFSTNNKLSQTIQNSAERIKQEQNNNYLKYQELFFKLYASHIAQQKKVAAQIKKIDSLCIMSDFPCKAIVQNFHQTGKTYSEQYVVQTFVRLGRAYKISQADNSSTADAYIQRLFFTPEFQNLIQEFKFGLKKENAMSWDNAFLVAESLVDIGYVDYEVFSILVNMVETRLNKQQRNQTQIREFQIQKKNYYARIRRHVQSNLSSDLQFQSVLNLLNQRVRQQQHKLANQKHLSQLKTQLTDSEQTKNIYNSIVETVSLIDNYSSDITKLIESVLVVRKQYRKMTKLSESKQILRNPEINLELLQLEEMLLMKKIISMTDIKSPQRIDNEDIELKRVQQILIQMIQPQGGQYGVNLNQINELLEINLNKGENKQAQRLSKLKDILQYGRAMAILSRFPQVSRRLYNAPDGRSLISMKWQKTLLIWNKTANQSQQWRQNLHQQKIFRRTFVDLIKIMKKSHSLFMFTFIEVPLKYKVQFFQALSRIGYHEQIIRLMSTQDTSKEKVQNYTKSEFFALIKVLNEVGLKINADHLKKAAVKNLKRLYETSQVQDNKSLFSMQFNINAINFICQNFNVHSADFSSDSIQKDQIQTLYENLINRLAEQVKYHEQSQNFLTNDQLYQALRILAMEKFGQFKFDRNFYARYEINIANEKQLKQFLYRKNPFHSIVQQLCQKYGQNLLNQSHSFIQTGFNSKGQLTAVLLCSSDQTSLEGKLVVGNINAYIHRVRRQLNINITPLATNSLIDIDYDKLHQSKQFSFKSKQHISNLLNTLFKRDELHLYKFVSILSNILPLLQKQFKKPFLFPIVKFLNTLNQCTKLFEREKQILSWPLFRLRRYRLYVQLDTLKQDYNLIDKSIKEELEKLWKKQSQSSSIQAFRKANNILAFTQAIQQEILNSVNNKNHEATPFTKDHFEGKRFTIETFLQNPQIKKSIGIQFINTTVYTDKTFCPYRDWANDIAKYYPLETIKLNSASNTTKILAKRFLSRSNEELTLLPFARKQLLHSRSQFTYNSLDPIKSKQTQSEQNIWNLPQNQVQLARQLLSFVHELKLSKSEQQVIDYIFSFDFISELTKSHQKQIKNPDLLTRKYGEYFNYLETKNNKLYLESTNLQYILNKLEQRQDVQEAFSKRIQLKSQIKLQYQLGQISRLQYFKKSQKIDDQLITALKTFNKNVLDNVEEYQFLQNGLKMIRIQQNQKELERILNRTRYYDRNLDKDFIVSRGNLDKCIRIKRNKAEKHLHLYKVLYKLGKGQVELTSEDQQVLKKQIANINYRLQNKKDQVQVYSQKYTHLTVKDLSKSDRQKLKLGGCDLGIFPELAISDIALQLFNLLDSKVYENFEKEVVKKYYSSTHKIPQQIFTSNLNKQFSQLAHKQQSNVINQHSKLDFYELGILNQMVQTFKTQSKTGKERFAQFYNSFNQDIQQMNNSSARVELISEYLDQKQYEYLEDYDPRLVTQIKQREVMKLWNLIFKHKYNQCETELIRNTVQKLCQRIRLMGDNSPPFFGSLVIKILSHPQTDVLTKQNLIAHVESYKTPLKIDSQDIRSMGYEHGSQERKNNLTMEQLYEKMGTISNTNFMENINKKINMIV